MSGSSAASSSARRSNCSSRRVHVWLAWICALPLLLSAITGTAYRVLRSAGGEKASLKWLMRVHTLEVVHLRAIYPLLLASLVAVLLLTGFSMTWIWNALRARCNRRRGGSGNSLARALQRYERVHSNAATGSAAEVSSAGTAAEESEWSEVDDISSPSNSGLHRAGSSPTLLSQIWRLLAAVPSLLPSSPSWRWLHRFLGAAAAGPLLVTTLTGGAYIVAGDWLRWEKAQYKGLMALHEGRWIEASGTAYVALLGSSCVALTAAGLVMLYRQTAALAAINARRAAAAAQQQALSPSSLAYARTRGGAAGGDAKLGRAAGRGPSTHASSASATEDEGGSTLQLAEADPTRQTLARIHQAFALDHSNNASETEDEHMFGAPPTEAQ